MAYFKNQTLYRWSRLLGGYVLPIDQKRDDDTGFIQELIYYSASNMYHDAAGSIFRLNKVYEQFYENPEIKRIVQYVYEELPKGLVDKRTDYRNESLARIKTIIENCGLDIDDTYRV